MLTSAPATAAFPAGFTGSRGGVPPLAEDSPLVELLDLRCLQRILLNFSRSLGISAAIIDLEGKVLAASPWQRLCTQFHRANEKTCSRCIESDTSLALGLQQGNHAAIYHCRNGLTDAAAPIVIGGRHQANLFTGQFLRAQPDEAFFLRQAVEFGFDGAEYLAALREVPVVPEEKIEAILGFMEGFAQMIASLAEEHLRVREEVRKNLEQEGMLIQQSRLASMGEMIGNIAHQWRQPLSALTLLLANIKDAHQYGELDQAFLDEALAEGYRLAGKMSSTIDDFRNFFAPNKEKTVFELRRAVNDALEILSGTLRNHNIEVINEVGEGIRVCGYPNEYSQVLLNILNNANEAILGQGVKSGRITLRAEATEGCAVLVIQDNGGGIDESDMRRIFDPRFTTKAQGSGIGLYMSKIIVENNMGGRVGAHNADGGAVFSVAVPLAA